MYEEHRGSDILSAAEPDSDQAWNANEVGFDRKGRWQRVLTSSKEQRLFPTTTGEKASLWVTTWLWTRADGRCCIHVHPSLVRQGSQLSKFQALGLPSDWIVHGTPSGYQDRDGFLKVCTEFVEYCGHKRPQYVFMDGHDSHFDSEALDLLASKHVNVFFLKLNNNEEGQPTMRRANQRQRAEQFLNGSL